MKKQEPKGKRRVPEWATAKTDYRYTGNIRHAALVIGKWPRNPPEWAMKACAEFAATLNGQVMGAAFAIGQRPGDPPQWALDIFQRLAHRCEIAHEPILRRHRRGPEGYPDDDELLEQMANLIENDIDDEMSVRAAALKVTDDGHDGPNAVRLQRKWKKETARVQVGEHEFETVHRRADRAFVRRIRG